MNGISEIDHFSASGIAALTLLIANAGLLFIYIAFDLTLFQIILVYWWEALWIGLFSGLKLLTASLFGDPYENKWVHISWGSSFLISVFAIIKSGAAFITMLALTGFALVVAHEKLTGITGNDFIIDQIELILKISMLFFVGHGISFVANFLLRGEFRHARISTLVWLPFKRCIALLVAIVAALICIEVYPGVLSYTSFALLLIGSKLAWDFVLHGRERRSLAADSRLEDSTQ
jgi:hypothetical protein